MATTIMIIVMMMMDDEIRFVDNRVIAKAVVNLSLFVIHLTAGLQY